jgi:hypothetical protein
MFLGVTASFYNELQNFYDTKGKGFGDPKKFLKKVGRKRQGATSYRQQPQHASRQKILAPQHELSAGGTP